MGGLEPKGDLAIAEIAFWSPALIIGIAITIKQGFINGASWIYLVTLSILRLIGASCTLYSETQNDYSESLLQAAFITSAIGTMPLLLVLLGILARLHSAMGPHGFPQIIFRPFHLIGLAGLVLSIVGGTELQPASSHSTGKDCLEAAGIIFLAIYLGLAVLAIMTGFKRRDVPATDKALVFVAVGVLPVLAVRIAYTVATVFSSQGSNFYYYSPNVVVQAVMQFAMEAIAVVIYSWGGLVVPKSQPPAQTGDAYSDVEEQKLAAAGGPQTGLGSRQYAPRQQQQQRQKSAADYLPSRMIYNAIRRNRN